MVYALYISNLDFLLWQNSQFEISKIYDIGLQRIFSRNKTISIQSMGHYLFFIRLLKRVQKDYRRNLNEPLFRKLGACTIYNGTI